MPYIVYLISRPTHVVTETSASSEQTNKQTNKHGAYAHETKATAILRHFIDECGLFETTTFDKTRGCFERLRRLGLTILLKVNAIKVVRYVILPVNTDRFVE
jgi:hypothetical protein